MLQFEGDRLQLPALVSRLALAGTVVGVSAAVASDRIMRRMLEGIGGADLPMLTIVAILLAMVTIAASLDSGAQGGSRSIVRCTRSGYSRFYVRSPPQLRRRIGETGSPSQSCRQAITSACL